MIELNQSWRLYYATTDPVRRQEMYEGLIKESDEDYAFAGELFARRHTAKNRPITEMDKYMMACMVFSSFQRNGFFAKKSIRKDTVKLLDDVGVNLVDNELKETLLYWEIRNALKRYYETCTSDSYRRKLFGLMKANDSERRYHIKRDTWSMSTGLLEYLGEVENMDIWNRAVIDEYSSMEGCKESDITNFKK